MSQPGIHWASERKPPASPGQGKAMTLVKFSFHVLTLFLSLGSLSLPPWLNLPFLGKGQEVTSLTPKKGFQSLEIVLPHSLI